LSARALAVHGLALALLVTPALRAQPTRPAEIPAPAAGPAQSPAGEQAAREAEALLQAAYRGRRTAEAVRELETQLVAVRKQPVQIGAPATAMMLGTLAGVHFAAGQELEGRAALRRLYHFARRIGDEALFYAGARRCLALPAFQEGATRLEEIEALEALRAELAGDGRWNTPYQAAERFMVALLDCIATGHVLDRRGHAALPLYREARARGALVAQRLQVEDPEQRRLGLVCSRLFPLAGQVSAHLVLGQIETAADLGEELRIALEAYSQGAGLPADHPAREVSEGTLEALEEQYRMVQAARRARGVDAPRDLAERRRRKQAQLQNAEALDELAEERREQGASRPSPFVSGPGRGAGR